MEFNKKAILFSILLLIAIALSISKVNSTINRNIRAWTVKR